MSYDLFLDDVRNPGDITLGWNLLTLRFRLTQAIPTPTTNGINWSNKDNKPVVVRSFDEFTDFIKTQCEHKGQDGLPAVISFDHDLEPDHYNGGSVGKNTGADCARWLVQFCLDNCYSFPDVFSHSMNPPGRLAIIMAFVDGYRFLELTKSG